jgi:hypothetical protein
MMILVCDDDYHVGAIERVDPKTNEIFITHKIAPRSHAVRLKREIGAASEIEHDIVSLTSLKLDPFSAVERLTTLLCVFVTETAIVSFMFGDPNEDKVTPAILLDFSLAVWTAIILTPITAPFAFLFRRAGPANMAHAVVDQAHIDAQHKRITALTTRLHEQWIAPEAESTGEVTFFYPCSTLVTLA